MGISLGPRIRIFRMFDRIFRMDRAHPEDLVSYPGHLDSNQDFQDG
jgi:hypothetical protein